MYSSAPSIGLLAVPVDIETIIFLRSSMFCLLSAAPFGQGGVGQPWWSGVTGQRVCCAPVQARRRADQGTRDAVHDLLQGAARRVPHRARHDAHVPPAGGPPLCGTLTRWHLHKVLNLQPGLHSRSCLIAQLSLESRACALEDRPEPVPHGTKVLFQATPGSGHAWTCLFSLFRYLGTGM